MRLLRRPAIDFQHKFPLAARQVLRGLDHSLDIEIAEIARSKHRHPLAAQLQLAPRLRDLRNAHLSVAAQPRLAFSGQANARAVLDAGGNIDRKSALARQPPGAAAAVAGVVDRLAASVARRAGSLDREKTLLRSDAAMARAGLAGGRFRPCLCA